MVDVSVFDAKNRLSALLDQVEHGGEEVTITRRGKPVARIVGIPTPLPPPGAGQRARALRSALARRGALLSADELTEWRDAGRR
jgi:prevent-host-death family protein